MNVPLYILFYKLHKKEIACAWISRHTPNVNFYYQWCISRINTGPTWKIALSLKNYRERYTQLECCCKFSVFVQFLQTALCTQNYSADGHSTCQASSCKNVQTPYAPCQNFTLLRISGDDYRIISTHIYIHSLCK